ncbi:alpha-amylase family glycosyl hydrolase [cyanobacterium endosymbiont of Epithemia turgida]
MEVIHRLYSLQDLGITALCFNSIFQYASNYDYHIHDYYTVDTLLGEN